MTRPHVIVILSDDHGYPTGCSGKVHYGPGEWHNLAADYPGKPAELTASRRDRRAAILG